MDFNLLEQTALKVESLESKTEKILDLLLAQSNQMDTMLSIINTLMGRIEKLEAKND
jgi:hypothetical protein